MRTEYREATSTIRPKFGGLTPHRVCIIKDVMIHTLDRQGSR